MEKISSLCFVSTQNAPFSSAQYPEVTVKKEDTPVQIHQVMGSSLRPAGCFPFLFIYRLSAFAFIRLSDPTFLHTFPRQGCYSVEFPSGSSLYRDY